MEDIASLFSDKTLRSKLRVTILAEWICEAKIDIAGLLRYAALAKDPVKATCIEALEMVTRQQPALADKDALRFVTSALTSNAPRVKWESARVVGNIAALFPGDLDDAIKNLVDNAQNEGTVVRWSTAFAIGEILKLKTRHNETLRVAIEEILLRERKSNIKKIYLNAIKKSEE